MRTLAIALVLLCSCAAFAQQREASFSQQRECWIQTKKVFEDHPQYGDYLSHYDAKANVCYAELSRFDLKDDGHGVFEMLVLDAFENAIRAQYAAQLELYPQADKIVFCYVVPIWAHGKKTTCTTIDEFRILIDKQFGIDTPN